MPNFLMHLRRHHLKQYAELIEAQEKCYLNTMIVIYPVIFYKMLYRLKSLCIAQLYSQTTKLIFFKFGM